MSHRKDLSDAVAMYEGGASVKEIAEARGVTGQAVLYVLHSRGVVLRKPAKKFTPGYYAYTHSTPDGIVFYVGKGTGRRAYLLTGRPERHQSLIDEVGRENVRVTIYAVADEREALRLELEMLNRLKGEGAPLRNNRDFLPTKRCVPLFLTADELEHFNALGGIEWVMEAISKQARKPLDSI